MIPLDLRRSLQEAAWPGLHIYTRFAGLQRYLELLDEYVPLMQNQALIRWQAEAARQAPPSNHAEWQELVSDLEVRLRHDISNNFLSAYLIPLSAALESSLDDLCEYVQVREALSIKAMDLREQTIVKRSMQYLGLAMRQPVQVPDSVRTALRDLQVVRNAFAHSNGRLEEQQPQRKHELEALASSNRGVTIWDGHLLVQPSFLSRSTEAAEELVSCLMEAVSRAYKVPEGSAP